MRIHRIEIEGFGPFRHVQQVDLTVFAADGLFLIGGETGAGKSSVLDAIAYALYGDTPRWDDVNATPRFRSDYCAPAEPTRVALEFSVAGTDYRVTRTPEYERPKSRGTGTTTQKATALLERRDPDGWTGVADRPRDVASAIAGIVRLTQDEFLQVILLAQGRFHRFLLATSDDRLTLLSKLFGARRFKDYQDRIAERRRSLRVVVERNADAVAFQLGSIAAPSALGTAAAGHELEWVDAVVADAAAQARDAKTTLSRAQAEQSAAEAAYDLAQRCARRREALAELAGLEQHRGEVDAVRITVEAADRAERVRALLDAVHEASAAFDLARERTATARLAYHGSTADRDLDAEVARLDQEIGAIETAVADEHRAVQVAADLAAAQAEEQTLAGQREQAGSALSHAESERARLVPVAALAKVLSERRDAARQRRDAAERLRSVDDEHRRAEQALLLVERRCEEALRIANDLLDRHLHGQAASLAAHLIDGQPCAVCGSTEHPAPASADVDVVDRQTVDAARGAVDTLDPERSAAQKAVEDLREQQARLRGIVGHTDLASTIRDLEQVQADLDAAIAAADRITRIDEDLDGPDGLRPATARLDTQRAEQHTRVVELSTELTGLQSRVEKARSDHASVAARHAALISERDAARTLATAMARQAAAEQQLARDGKRLDTQATAEGFTAPADAAAALVPADDLTAWRARVTTFDEAIVTARTRIDAPDLQDLPEEAMDLATARADLAAAKQQRDLAAAAHTTADNALVAVRGQRERLADLLDAVSTSRAELAVLARLADTVVGRGPNSAGMSLESYYVAAELEEVLVAANGRLRAMTGGRYQLLHTERGILHANARTGLELEVMDENTGRARDPHTLSGGEQFLASLALALGLAEVVTGRAGGVELETLFVDEGFGSLSPEFLEVAMATLDSLKQGGRTIGVISHVDAMKESIGARLDVVRTPAGWSRIDQPD